MLTSTNKSNVGNARKILSFYRLNYGLNAPYTALVDSETMLQSSKVGVYLKDAVPKLLGGDGIKLSVTDCTVRRLRSLGEDAKGCELFARRLQRISCSCSVENETQCLKDIVDRRIDLIMIVCHLTSIKLWPPHAAVIVLNKHNTLVFKSPSKQSIEQAKQSHAERIGVLSQADKMLVQQATEEERESRKRKRGQDFGNDSSQASKKRKKAKGPNPLSVKKPTKPKNNASSGSDMVVKANSNTEGRSQTKKRRTRGKRAKTTATTTIDIGTGDDSTNKADNRNSKFDKTSQVGTDIATADNKIDKANNPDVKAEENSSIGTEFGQRDAITDMANNPNAKFDETNLAGAQDTNMENVIEKELLESTALCQTSDPCNETSGGSGELEPTGDDNTVKGDLTEKEFPIESAAADQTLEPRDETNSGLESAGGGNAVKEGDLIESESKKKKKQRKNRRRPGSNKKIVK